MGPILCACVRLGLEGEALKGGGRGGQVSKESETGIEEIEIDSACTCFQMPGPAARTGPSPWQCAGRKAPCVFDRASCSCQNRRRLTLSRQQTYTQSKVKLEFHISHNQYFYWIESENVK